jgi:RNA polymerase sigma-70 factor (ECF subfamily)
MLASTDINKTEPTEADIQTIVARAQRGDPDGFARLFDIFGDRIYRFIRVRLSDTETAEDLTQTVFLEMLQAIGRYRPRPNAKFSTWLFQIARFRLIDQYRQHRPQVSIDDLPAQAHPNLSVEAVEYELPMADELLNQLPENYRTVLHLRYQEQLTTKEIAEVLKTSVINVRVLHYRAIRAARKLLPSD